MRQITIDLTDAEWHALAVKSPSPERLIRDLVAERVARVYGRVYEARARELLDDPDVATMPADKDTIVLSATIPEWLPLEEA
jgi:hypothetical protein